MFHVEGKPPTHRTFVHFIFPDVFSAGERREREDFVLVLYAFEFVLIASIEFSAIAIFKL